MCLGAKATQADADIVRPARAARRHGQPFSASVPAPRHRAALVSRPPTRGRCRTARSRAQVKVLFGAVGKIYQVQENLIDAVTGLRCARAGRSLRGSALPLLLSEATTAPHPPPREPSGSGPAYVFMMIEALAVRPRGPRSWRRRAAAAARACSCSLCLVRKEPMPLRAGRWGPRGPPQGHRPRPRGADGEGFRTDGPRDREGARGSPPPRILWLLRRRG